MWMHSSEFTWLREHIEQLRASAVQDITAGVDMERYAELRGYIQACDAVLQSPEKYLALKRAELAQARDEDAA
jgi:hypothetical protein